MVWILSGLFLYLTKVVNDTLGDCLWTLPGGTIVNSIPRSIWLIITISVLGICVGISSFGMWLYMKFFYERQDKLPSRNREHEY